MSHLRYRKLPKQDRIKHIFSTQLGKITKADIKKQCPDISETTIERALNNLLSEGFIEKIGAGRGVGYIKKG